MRFQVFSSMFNNHPQAVLKNNKKCTPFLKGFNNFKVFTEFMELSFENLTYLELATFYRDCYCIGRGFINCEIFLAYANESNFFIRFLKERYNI